MLKSNTLEYLSKQGIKKSDLPKNMVPAYETLEQLIEAHEAAVVENDSATRDEAKELLIETDKEFLSIFKKQFPVKKSKSTTKKPKGKSASGAKFPLLDKEGKRRIDEKALDALEKHLDSLPSTKSMHIDKDGNYTDGRKLVHIKIIDDMLEGKKCIRQDKPIAILTGGSPGSGKSTWIRNNKDWLTSPNIFAIDADDTRAKLPEYAGWNAGQTHSETQDIVRALLSKVGTSGCSYDVIYDGTMKKVAKYHELVKVLKNEGYDIYIIYMDVPKEVSYERAMNRFKGSGRYVPRFVLDDAAKRGNKAFDELKKSVTGYVRVDGVSQKIMEKGGAEIPDDRDYDRLSSFPNKKKPTTKILTSNSWDTKGLESGKSVFESDKISITFKDKTSSNGRVHTLRFSYKSKVKSGEIEKELVDFLSTKFTGFDKKSIKVNANEFTLIAYNTFRQSKPSKKTVNPTKKTEEKGSPAPSEYTWLKPNDMEGAKQINFNCSHYIKKLDMDTMVSLKGAGSSTIKIMAKKGESLIFDDNKHLVYVMNPNAAKNKCVEVEKKKYHYQGLRVSIKSYGNQYVVWDVEKDQKFANEKFSTKKEALKFITDNKMKFEGSSEPTAKPTPKKISCYAKELKDDQLPSNTELKIQGMIQAWNDDNGLVEIKKIYIVDIGNGKKDIVLQLKKWNVFKIFGKVTNRRICLKSSKISTKDYGKLSTKSKNVSLLRSEADMKKPTKAKIYTLHAEA